MAKVNDLKSSVVLVSDGNYSGKKLYSVGLTVGGTKYFLAYTPGEADKMADEIAAINSTTIASQEALVAVYLPKGFTVV